MLYQLSYASLWPAATLSAPQSGLELSCQPGTNIKANTTATHVQTTAYTGSSVAFDSETNTRNSLLPGAYGLGFCRVCLKKGTYSGTRAVYLFLPHFASGSFLPYDSELIDAHP